MKRAAGKDNDVTQWEKHYHREESGGVNPPKRFLISVQSPEKKTIALVKAARAAILFSVCQDVEH